jgi:hypothetical protein
VSVILVIQPDHSQTKVLQDVARRIGTELLIVDSTARAVEAIGRRIPDLILLSPFLSPRDEDTLMDKLRSLDGTSHLQTLSIPQFRASEDSTQKKKSGFGFRKKHKTAVAVGAEPAAFAEEVVALLHRASEVRNRPAPPEPIVPNPYVAEHAIEEFIAEDTVIEEPAVEEPVFVEPLVMESPVEEPVVDEALIEEMIVPVAEPVADVPVFVPEAHARWKPAISIADEISQLVRRLGLDVRPGGDTDETAAVSTIGEANDADVFTGLDAETIQETAMAEARAVAEHESHDPIAAEIARVQAEAEMLREAAMAEARAVAEHEAREALAADLHRAQVDADQIREMAMAEARAVAEREAREALAADLQRVQAEAEEMRETAIAEARAAAEREARDTLAVEVARVRSEAESTFTDALNKVKTDAEEAERQRIEAERVKTERLNAEAQQAFARELARVRAEVEQSLAVQLDAARAEADRIRAAESQAVQERAAVESQLKVELDRLRFVTAQTRKADESETKKAAQQIKHLEAELAIVRAKTEERKGDEIEELRTQMAEMREAAAQYARAAAAEAVAAEVARATARPTIVVQPFQAHAPTRMTPPVEEIAHGDGRDYLSLWQPRAAEPVAAAHAAEDLEEPADSGTPINVRRHAKWALPVAACLILVINTGTAIGTFTRFVTTDEKPVATVQPMHEETPFIEVVEKRVGQLKIDSTPSGAEVILGGKGYGRTPVTIPDLDVGLHTLVLKSRAGNITRKVTIKANRTTLLTEAIYSGWLAIFSSIPVSVKIDGQAVNLSEDGRLMTTPGTHVLEFVNAQFNYRATETLSVQPGETTAHTLTLPTGTVRVRAPQGSEVRVDGNPVPGDGSQGFAVPIGAHEISARHPERGERRVSIDVKRGGLTEVTLPYE